MQLNEEDAVIFKQWVREHLSAGPVVVTFTKTDGTTRVMPCTTSPTVIMFKSGGQLIETKSTPSENEKTMVVFDLESNSWKSFRWDSVQRVNIEA